MPSYETIKVETRDAVRILTLNRPDRLNAWTPLMMSELISAIEAANDDAAIGAIVMTGEGRGFCAGADIKDVFGAQIETGGDQGRGQGGDWVGLCRRSKPLIAAVNGVAVGIGVTMILPFDVIVAGAEAKFILPFVKMGIVPELASSHFLAARMGLGRASEILLSGRAVPGEEAVAKGLADFLAGPGAVMDEALRIAGTIAANPDSMLRLTKRLLTENALERDWALVQKREGQALETCYASPEHREAVAAFMEKRPARFRPG